MDTITLSWNALIWGGLFFYLPLLLIAFYFFFKKEFIDLNDKVIWALGIVFLPIVGSLLFLFVGLRSDQ